MTMVPQEQPAESAAPAEPVAPAEPAEPTPAPAELVAPPQPVPELPAAEARPSIADGIERSLDPRSVSVQRIVSWLVIAPIMAGQLLALLLILFLAPLPGWAMALLILVGVVAMPGLAWLAHRWPEIEHRHASYKVDGRVIEIRRGVVWRKVINVPRSRVQHTDVSQGPVERSHGLATLVIYTAGTDHAKVDLHGLDHAAALAIRLHLLAGEGDDAV